MQAVPLLGASPELDDPQYAWRYRSRRCPFTGPVQRTFQHCTFRWKIHGNYTLPHRTTSLQHILQQNIGPRTACHDANVTQRISSHQIIAHEGAWRNGSASDSRSEGWEFESLCPHFRIYACRDIHKICRSISLQKERHPSIISALPNDWQLAAPGTLAAEFDLETDTSIPGQAASNAAPGQHKPTVRLTKWSHAGLNRGPYGY